jgi:hypothetical protein
MKHRINHFLLIISALVITTGCATTEKTLFLAAEAGDNDSVRALLDKGDSVNPQDPNEYTPLMFASMNGHADTVELLIDAGADVNRNPEGMTALIFSSMEGHADIVRLLLEAGADVNKIYRGGQTALMAAAEHNHVDTVKELIEAGADVNVRNGQGLTAMRLARDKGHTDVVQLLKERGALSEDQLRIMLVIIDQTENAYTVFYGLPEWMDKKEIEEIKTKIKKEKVGIVIEWEQFRQNTDTYVDSRIIRNEYGDIPVARGIVELIEKYRLTPIGLTWNGGVAITRNDYEHARETYNKFMVDYYEYERMKKESSYDPVNPNWHLGPLLGW